MTLDCVICAEKAPAPDLWQCANLHPGGRLHFDCVVKHFITRYEESRLQPPGCPLCRRAISGAAAAQAEQDIAVSEILRFMAAPNASRSSSALRICDVPGARELSDAIVARARRYYHLEETTHLRSYGRLLLGTVVSALKGNANALAALPQILALGDGDLSPAFATYRALALLRVLAKRDMNLFHMLLPPNTQALPITRLLMIYAQQVAHDAAMPIILALSGRRAEAAAQKLAVVQDRLAQLTVI